MLIFFVIFGVLSLASAIGVVLSKNPLHSALCLIANLVLVAALYAMLGADFLAVAQLVVYAGAIMVLVLFVIMLLNIKSESKTSIWSLYYFTAAVVAGSTLWVLTREINSGFAVIEPIGAVATRAPVAGTVVEIGKLLFTKYLFAFEIASVLLLVALVGAVMLAKRDLHTQLKAGGEG